MREEKEKLRKLVEITGEIEDTGKYVKILKAPLLKKFFVFDKNVKVEDVADAYPKGECFVLSEADAKKMFEWTEKQREMAEKI